MKGINHRLVIGASARQVYEALTTEEGLSGWWSPATKAKPQTETIATFAFDKIIFKEMKIEELNPLRLVKWLCLKGWPDWIGTTITFELAEHPKGTELIFHHDGWEEITPGVASCSYDWAMFLRSLKFLCETGKGFPYPDQYK